MSFKRYLSNGCILGNLPISCDFRILKIHQLKKASCALNNNISFLMCLVGLLLVYSIGEIFLYYPDSDHPVLTAHFTTNTNNFKGLKVLLLKINFLKKYEKLHFM